MNAPVLVVLVLNSFSEQFCTSTYNTWFYSKSCPSGWSIVVEIVDEKRKETMKSIE
jgi:hypothetical protein